MKSTSIDHIGFEVQHIEGPGHLAPLVFLHEGLGSVAMWQTRAGDWPAQVCAAAGRAGHRRDQLAGKGRSRVDRGGL